MSQPLIALLERSRSNAIRCWVLLVIMVLVVGYDIVTAGYVSGVLGIGVIIAILGPPIVFRTPREMLPWELVFVATAALIAREVVLWQPIEFLGNYLVIAALALVLAVEIQLYTRLVMNRIFAMVFVAMMTMTVATAWTLGRWALDQVVGTTFLPSNEALMWELIAATAVGIGAGILFEYYLRWRPDEENDHGHTEQADGKQSRDEESATWREQHHPTLSDRIGLSDRHQRGIVHLLQLGLAGVAIVGFVRLDAGLTVTAILALAVTFLPAILQREYAIPMGIGLTLWIATAVFLHTLGTLYFYGDYLWWHHITHAVSGSLIAGIGYATFRAIDEYTTAVRFPSQFMFVLILLFVVSIGVLWEIFEFATDQLLLVIGSDEVVLAQHGLYDTMTDMLFNVGGAIIVATWGTIYLTGVAAGLREQFQKR